MAREAKYGAVRAAAQQIKAGNVATCPHVFSPEQRPYDSEAFKTEFYALLAVFISRIVGSIHTRFFVPQDVLSGMSLDQALDWYSDYIDKALTGEYMDQQIMFESQLIGDKESEDASFYQRYKELLGRLVGSHAAVSPDGKFSNYDPVGAGIKTATNTMREIARLTPIVYARDRGQRPSSGAEAAELLSSAFPLASGLALLHLRDFTRFRDQYSLGNNADRRFLPSMLAINGARMSFSHEAQLRLNELEAQNARRGVTLGCPAMVLLEQETAVQTVWGWYEQGARQIYSQHFGEKL